MTIQIIGTYDINLDSSDDEGSIFLVHTRAFHDSSLDNKILEMSIISGNLHVFHENKVKLIYPAFPSSYIDSKDQLYILDLDLNGEALTAIKANMVINKNL